MSKSLGNFFTVREVLKSYKAEVIRFFILTSHYRSPLNYSDEHLDDAGTALTRLYTALRGVNGVNVNVDGEYKSRFEQAMDDDFNTPVALSVLFDLARELNRIKGQQLQKAEELAGTMKFLGNILGILQDDPDSFLKSNVIVDRDTALSLSDEAIEQQIQARLDAKKHKDWATADRIRDELKEQGIVLEDVPGGTNWRRE
jgi:cysteinyl-tRNA synthetase